MTPETAKKYFGAADPIGKTPRLDGGDEGYLVTGIAAANPVGSLHDE